MAAPPKVGSSSQGHDIGYVVTMIGKSSRMNGVKPQQFDGIGVGTMRQKLGRGPRPYEGASAPVDNRVGVTGLKESL